jgi:5'-nucleotidase
MDGGRNAGLGGAERRAAIIRAIRSEEEHVLLLDSGDIWQGTPYFNFFGGELEFKLMSEMQYDAATIGNHDFDAGIEGLVKQLPHASFPFLNCNYEVKDTALFDHIQPFRVFNFGSVRVGVTGVGIELAGLVPDKLYGDVRYLDPVQQLNQTAAFLKEEEKCDYVICLSHLGYNYDSNKIDDRKLAGSTKHVDLILGGHTHTFMPGPEVLGNLNNNPVTIHQVGWAGIILGRIDVFFERGRKDHCITCENRLIKA